MSDKKILKILFLHGYRQSAKVCREKTGSFRKAVKNIAEIVYICAPNEIKKDINGEDLEESSEHQYGWWFSNTNEDNTHSYNAHVSSDCDYGFKESLDTVKLAFETQGPFDGIMGFSQGASMLSLICSLKIEQENTLGSSPYKFNFAIFVAGFKSRCSSHSIYYLPECSYKIEIPALHVIGDTDKVIENEMSVALVENYSTTTILNHPGGHFVPASGPQKAIYKGFLNKQF